MADGVTDGLEINVDIDEKDSPPSSHRKKESSVNSTAVSKKSACKKHRKSSESAKSLTGKKNKSKKASKTSAKASSSTSEDSDAADTEITSESSDAQEESKSTPRKTKSKTVRQKAKSKKARKDSDAVDALADLSTSSDSDSMSDTEAANKSKSKKTLKKPKTPAKKASKNAAEDGTSDSEEDEGEDEATSITRQMQLYSQKMKQLAIQLNKKKKAKKAKAAVASKVAFKRVDQLWDEALHDFKLTESADHQGTDEFDKYIFTVRRKFDWEHRYESTTVDIRSKPLKEALTKVMEGVNSISLHVAVPKIDPNLLFLYLEDMRTYMNEMKRVSKSEKKPKLSKAAAIKSKHLKVLVEYLDTDFAEVKKTLYPMLENGTISFEYLWALYKPNTIAYTSTYGDAEEPRAFKIDFATKENSFTRGTWFLIEGKYLEYTGKAFGLASMHSEVDSFKGTRSITSLSCYPLKYHKDAANLREKLIERGKKFVTLKGMNYKHHKGMAYMKKKRQTLRVSIDSRVMIDPAIFRRINPNYMMGTVKARDDGDLYPSDDDSDDDSCCCGDESEDEQEADHDDRDEERSRRKHYRLVRDRSGRSTIVEIEYDENGEEVKTEETLEKTSGGEKGDDEDNFTEEELLIANPVVLGFSFHEKLWLEFSVSGVGEVRWNEGAFESLVLPSNQKSIVRALVSSHKFHQSKNVDDIITNKGLGCTIVLHGPPGTGKTLTAEGIAESLKAPLYMVSAGELGTDPRTLERELQNILDIAHSWGAILLLDEADVFMEKRSLHDIHRNSLVGIFLRLLEYFQGILFLTTNRVETFDDAFQSRIHVALRYGELDYHARKSVWRMFITKIRAVPDIQIGRFDEPDLDRLAKRSLNGRQIKNAARAAQALAVDQGKPLSMSHVEEVLRVAQSFEQDLKGGTGYEDVMRSYT